MKIGIVGCGALGSYYGAKLAQKGQEVHFLLRSDYSVVSQQGVRILSADGDFTVHPHCSRNPEDIGMCDWVIIGLKSTANSEFEHLLPPLVGAHTAVLTLQNGLGNEEQLATLFPKEQILGGLCFVCLNRIEPGVIQHIAHGRIVMGEFGRESQPRTDVLASQFRHAGIPCDVTDRLARAHWEKLVWNIPFNGLGVASAAGLKALYTGVVRPGEPLGPCLPTDRLLEHPEWELLVRELMRETIAVARALGLEPEAGWEETQVQRTRSMGSYKASTLIDYERKMPLELNALFLEPLRLAQKAGVQTPRLAHLCAVLRALDGRPPSVR